LPVSILDPIERIIKLIGLNKLNFSIIDPADMNWLIYLKSSVSNNFCIKFYCVGIICYTTFAQINGQL